MLDDRIDKLRALVLTARDFAGALERQVQAGRITRADAIAEFRDDIHHIRFGSADDYFLAQTAAGIVVMHGGDPSREAKLTTARDDAGHTSAELANLALGNGDLGKITYSVAKPGSTRKLPKLSYVARFAPWRLDFIAGSWIDDIDAAYSATLERLIGMSGIVIVTTALLGWLVNRDITGPVSGLKAAMTALTKGDLETMIPGTTRRDEVGEMAASVMVFKQHMVHEERLQAEQQIERREAEEKKAAALREMAETIEVETHRALTGVDSRSRAMAATADAMQASATRTKTSAETAAAAAGQALANAQTVASAAEQLSSSIREISGQVAESNSVVSRAVAAAAETRTAMETLNAQVGRIGAVADMIGEIAAKTNLLALNATIEAARAGDAGKGFAVVASEVKALATQTARSTQEIARHIAEVRSATEASVSAVGRIEQTIAEVNAISSSIAAAVEEQGAATAEIARNVTETASAANGMADRVGDVSAEAEETGRHSNQVRDHASALTTAMEGLRHAVVRAVRTSTADVDRRQTARIAVASPCRLNLPGGNVTVAELCDISEAGASVRGAPDLPQGARGTLGISGIGFALPFIVRSAGDGQLHIAFDDSARAAVQSFVEARQIQRAA